MPPIVLEVDDEWGVIVGDLLNVKSDYARKGIKFDKKSKDLGYC